MEFVLASASPARLAVLRAAGLTPRVVVSEVDEHAIERDMAEAAPEDVVRALATAKASAVASTLGAAEAPTVVLGCDSMLLMPDADGRQHVVGKPGTAEIAIQRWRRMAGSSARLLTGHCLIAPGPPFREVAAVESTVVHFGEPTEAELQAYLATGEPLRVAGGFTLDGLGGWFVRSIEGDPSSVVGVSLPLLRRLLAEFGISPVQLWSPEPEDAR